MHYIHIIICICVSVSTSFRLFWGEPLSWLAPLISSPCSFHHCLRPICVYSAKHVSCKSCQTRACNAPAPLQWQAPRWEPYHAEAHVLLGQGEKMANQPVGQSGLSPRAEGTLLEQEGSHRELRWPCVPMCRRSLVLSWNTEVKGWFSRLSQRETCLLLEYQQDSNKDHLH